MALIGSYGWSSIGVYGFTFVGVCLDKCSRAQYRRCFPLGPEGSQRTKLFIAERQPEGKHEIRITGGVFPAEIPMVSREESDVDVRFARILTF